MRFARKKDLAKATLVRMEAAMERRNKTLSTRGRGQARPGCTTLSSYDGTEYVTEVKSKNGAPERADGYSVAEKERPGHWKIGERAKAQKEISTTKKA